MVRDRERREGKTPRQLVRDAVRSEVARQTGISLSGISRILSGERRASARNTSLVALCLGLTMDELHKELTRLRNRVLAEEGKQPRTSAA